MNRIAPPPRGLEKFEDPKITADGQVRATVSLLGAKTLWFNTGTLCNIECVNCYIHSSPSNDSLIYLTTSEVRDYLAQIRQRDWPVEEIGFTGGEPFMNPEAVEMIRACLNEGYDVLVLTNAMQPMLRKKVQSGLAELIKSHGDKITFRVSIDHVNPARNDEIRGKGSFEKTLEGMAWLRDQGAKMAIASRMLWNESEAGTRKGFQAHFSQHGFAIDAQDPASTVLFPEMDETADVPEITTACWGILGKDPADIMCASSRMVVKRKGAAGPTVLACTLLPYSDEFELGPRLKDAEKDVSLNHRHCAKFCVLGGASCSA